MFPVLSLPSGPTKKAIAELSLEVVSNIQEKGNALKAAESLAALDNFIKAVKENKEYKEAVLSELALHGKSFTFPSGAKIEAVEVGVSYDYSRHPEWVELNNEIILLTEQKKALEEKLKSIGAGKEIVDKETGEIFTGAAKSSTSSYRLTLSK